MAARQIRNVINGHTVDGGDGRTRDLINPTTGEVFAEAVESNERDVDSAYRAASDAFPGWRDTTPGERQKALLAIADLFESNAAELVALESENTGKPLALTASEEVPPMVDQIRFLAGRGYWSGDSLELPDDDGRMEVHSGHCSR